MRKKLVFVCLFFLLMASLPLWLLPQTAETQPQAGSADSAEPGKPEEENEIMSVARLCDDSFSDEAIRAVAVLQRTNAAAGADNEASGSGSVSPALLRRVTKQCRSCRQLLTYRGKAVPVPLSACTCGYTVKSPQYPYLDAVASPWDAFCEKSAGAHDAAGVSLNGIRCLCDRGMSAEEALHWYAPQLAIS